MQQQQQQQQQSGHHRTSSAPPAPAPQGQLPQQQIPGQQQQMPPAPPPQPPAPPAPPCPPSMMNFPGAIAQQYGQSPQSQQAPSPAGVGGNIYGTTGGGQPQQQQQAPYQYGSTGSQYGSRASLNSQYASITNAGGPGPGQYVGQGQALYGQVVSQQPQSAGSPVVVNPYGTPNGVTQAYAQHQPVNMTSQAQELANAYAPCGSVANMGQQPGVVQPPPPPPMQGMPMQMGGGGAPPPPPPPPVPSCGASNGFGGHDERPPAPDVNSLAAALQAAKLKKKQVRWNFRFSKVTFFINPKTQNSTADLKTYYEPGNFKLQ